MDTVARIRELNDFNYIGLTGVEEPDEPGESSEFSVETNNIADGEPLLGSWASNDNDNANANANANKNDGWARLWDVVSRHMDEVPNDVVDDRLLFEACVLDKVWISPSHSLLHPVSFSFLEKSHILET